jgi:hypothetical protein
MEGSRDPQGSPASPGGGTAKAEYAAETSQALNEHVDFGKFTLIALQLALLLLVIRQFQIQSGAFLRISIIAFGGFAIHYFLPMRWRMPLFALLSLAAIGVVFGFTQTFWLVGFGLVLIGICHLPLALPSRLGLLVGVGLMLAMFRVELITGPWSRAIWPILGAMFMFRLIVYLYDMHHGRRMASISATIGYFFMVPNVCFPLFPVVDSNEYRRTYYDTERHQIYQSGVDWMVRGIIHLILYRYIYYYVTPCPSGLTPLTTPCSFRIPCICSGRNAHWRS